MRNSSAGRKTTRLRLAEELPHEDDRGEVLAYAIYREHCESINDCETVQSINEWAEVKMPSFFKAIEAKHQPSANHLYAMAQKAALTRIDALRRLEGEQSEEGVAGSGYSTEYLRFQEQLYSRMNSLDLDRWAFAVQASIDKLNPNEKAALFAEIGERRTELQKIEAVAGQQE